MLVTKKALSALLSSSLLILVGIIFSLYVIDSQSLKIQQALGYASFGEEASLERQIAEQKFIEYFSRNKVYLQNPNEVNVTFSKLLLGNELCLENITLTPGVNSFDLSSCYTNDTLEVEEIVLYKKNSLETKRIYISSLS